MTWQETSSKKRIAGRLTNQRYPTICHLNMVNETDSGSKSTAGHLKLALHLTTHWGNIEFQGIVDCGATVNFISLPLMEELNIALVAKEGPRIVGVNRGKITLAGNTKFFKLTFTIQGNQPSSHWFRGVIISHQFILGLPWLWASNPVINWKSSEIEITDNMKVEEPEDFLKDLDMAAEVYAYLVEEKGSELPEEYWEFSDVFNEKSDTTLPPHRKGLDHAIKLLPGVKPTFSPLYNLSQWELEVLKTYIEKNLESGFIQRSTSSVGAPILFIKKKDSSLQLCVDYWWLNAISEKDRYLIPLVSEILDHLSKAKVFTKIDLRGAYNLIRIQKGDEYLTAFRTHYRSFEYRVMLFRMCNALSTFQSLINRVLQKFLDKFVIVYLDNILIYSDCLNAHTDQVKQVLQALWENQLFTKLEKCVFSQDTVEYLGFIVSTQGISMDPAQVNTITTWPTLSSVKDVLTFLGFCNFYWRFIAWYSKMLALLLDLMKKGEKWNWTAEHNKCFGDLKDAFVNHQVIRPFNPELQSFLETDSSGFAIAGIASQISDQDTIKLTKKDGH